MQPWNGILTNTFDLNEFISLEQKSFSPSPSFVKSLKLFPLPKKKKKKKKKKRNNWLKFSEGGEKSVAKINQDNGSLVKGRFRERWRARMAGCNILIPESPAGIHAHRVPPAR